MSAPGPGPIDKNKIIEAIHDLSTHSAPGPDGVPAIVFKECAEALSEPLMILFNSFFDCHYIPDILKRAAIVPVYKSGEKSNPINYRPISLTPILMKILERIVRKQVVQFLTDNNLNSTQHGFREGRSTIFCSSKCLRRHSAYDFRSKCCCRHDLLRFC